MKRILLVLVALILSYMPAQADLGEGSLDFNDTSFTDGLAVGLLADDAYYTLVILDGDFTETSSSARFISALMYVPKDLLVDGTHDLVILKPSKQSSTTSACDDDPKKFTLPSNDKVFIVLSDTNLTISSSFTIVKGIVASSDDGSGTITFRNVTNTSGLINVEGDFAIHTNNSKYSAKVPSSELLDCKTAQKQTVVKITKNSGSSDASGSFSTSIIDFSSVDFSDNFRVTGLPTHPYLLKK